MIHFNTIYFNFYHANINELFIRSLSVLSKDCRLLTPSLHLLSLLNCTLTSENRTWFSEIRVQIKRLAVFFISWGFCSSWHGIIYGQSQDKTKQKWYYILHWWFCPIVQKKLVSVLTSKFVRNCFTVREGVCHQRCWKKCIALPCKHELVIT